MPYFTRHEHFPSFLGRWNYRYIDTTNITKGNNAKAAKDNGKSKDNAKDKGKANSKGRCLCKAASGKLTQYTEYCFKPDRDFSGVAEVVLQGGIIDNENKRNGFEVTNEITVKLTVENVNDKPKLNKAMFTAPALPLNRSEINQDGYLVSRLINEKTVTDLDSETGKQ